MDDEDVEVEETDNEEETDDEDDEEYGNGEPLWYEPTLCWRCNQFFMPNADEDTYCDRCVNVIADELSEFE